MDIKIDDILVMKKTHPCGCNEFLVRRVGADIGVKCVKCEHYMLVPRKKIEKNIKNIKPVE
ncbi:MAG: DUF951 domain-containing protein [Clostridia bacterium]|nr:DUF951 domain-containing protein [Clostridia bacterium]